MLPTHYNEKSTSKSSKKSNFKIFVILTILVSACSILQNIFSHNTNSTKLTNKIKLKNSFKNHTTTISKLNSKMSLKEITKKLYVEESNNFENIENLIILPCHSIFAPELNKNFKDDETVDPQIIGQDPENWLLESFQTESNDQISFLKHIELSLNELNSNLEDSVLVISGGFTKSKIEKSESSSYYELAQKSNLLKKFPNLIKGENILLEEYARDSYENILYSLVTFYQKFGKFPKKVSVVGFGFKRERFLLSHLTTFGYYNSPMLGNSELNLNKLPNTKHAKYIGAGPFLTKPDYMNENQFSNYETDFRNSLRESETKNALDLFKMNPFGSIDSKLNEKKIKRDPWNKHQEINTLYVTDNKILNSFLEIDHLNIGDAWNMYQKEILPNLPLYEN